MRLCPIPILIHVSECSVQLGLEPLRPLWGHELDCTWSQRSTLCTQFANQAFASSNKHITTPLLLQCPTQRASLLQFDYNGQNLLKMVVKVIKYCITISHTAHTPHCTRPTLYTPHTAHAPHCTRPTLYTPHTVHTPHCTRPTLYTPHTVHIPHCTRPTLYTPHTVHAPHCTRPTLYTPHTAHAPHCTRPTLYTPHTVHTPHCTHPTLYTPHTVHTPHCTQAKTCYILNGSQSCSFCSLCH